MPRFEGIIEEIRFRNEENGWTVAMLRYGKKRIAAVGVMPFLAVGEHVALSGEWVEHRDYGAQIKVESYEVLRPKTKTAIERYLASGLIRGVGPKTAKLLVEYFGEKTLEVLDSAPERLCEVPGIKQQRAEMILESYQEHRQMQSEILYLQSFEIPMGLALKILKRFGDKTRALLETDPYRLADEIEGVGFRTVDSIARSMGIPMEDPHRLECGMQYALKEAAASEGHTFLPEEVLFASAARLLGVAQEMLEQPLKRLALCDRFCIEMVDGKRNVYLPEYYEAEREVAARLLQLARYGVKPIPTLPPMDVELGEEQMAAVRACMNNTVLILTGGPGTGKTTCIQCILRMFKGQVELCAPTGRAAKRITEATGRDARTIHRALEYSGEEGKFLRNEGRPLSCEAVIVDEVSMVDLFLMRSLLRAIAPGTRLIFVGDADQLPSVGAGNVLGDMIESGVLPLAKLTTIYRQAQESMIVMNAHRINRGEMPVLRTKNTNFFFERKENANDAASSTIALVKTRLPGFAGFHSMRDIQVMAPMKRGITGVYEMNRMLQEALNPRRPGVAELPRGEAVFRVGDKVMQTRNNYDLSWEKDGEEGEGVFNGDIGFIRAIDRTGRCVTVAFDDGREVVYGEGDWDALEHAYCISVHKSQGSEFEAVVLPIVSGPPMLMNRNLLYTAVTRARRMVVIVGREAAIWQMVSNKRMQMRYSALGRRLRENAKQQGEA